MTASPRVSVLLCTRSRPELLARAVDSVLTQTMRDLELIVVDDASDDDTAAYLASVDDPRLRTLRNESPLGLPASRNVALVAARGEHVAFLDDDDEYVPTKLEHQLAVLERSPDHVGAVWCFQRWVHGETVRSRRIVLRGDVRRHLAATDVIQMQSLLVRGTAAAEIGPFDPYLSHYDDFDWTLRLARRFEFETVEEELVVMHATPGSLSTRARSRVDMARHVIAKHPEIADSPPLRARWLIRAAESWAEAGDGSAWRRTMVEAWRAHPTGLRAPVYLFLGCLGGPATPNRVKWAFNRLLRRFRIGTRRLHPPM